MSKKVGIQGGNGSFNHQGWIKYAKEHDMADWEIVFLHTTKNVLSKLEEGGIKKGQFGIYNTLGGLVEETARELGGHKFNVIDWYKFPIRHFLMKRKGVDEVNIKNIMAHPQGFKQCKSNLAEFFPELEQIVNQGEMLDPSKIAEKISTSNLGDNTAVIGSEILASLYNLEIVKGDMQDGSDNFTTFVLVE